MEVPFIILVAAIMGLALPFLRVGIVAAFIGFGLPAPPKEGSWCPLLLDPFRGPRFQGSKAAPLEVPEQSEGKDEVRGRP